VFTASIIDDRGFYTASIGMNRGVYVASIIGIEGGVQIASIIGRDRGLFVQDSKLGHRRIYGKYCRKREKLLQPSVTADYTTSNIDRDRGV
jgi:hypothetical protein